MHQKDTGLQGVWRKSTNDITREQALVCSSEAPEWKPNITISTDYGNFDDDDVENDQKVNFHLLSRGEIAESVADLPNLSAGVLVATQ